VNVLYHVTNIPPQFPECEAISQEINLLRRDLGGEVIYLNPNHRSPIYVPRAFFGLHRLRQLRSLESSVDIHHLYNPDPFPFPILRTLRKPVVYSITGGVNEPIISRRFFASLAALTVGDEDSRELLRSQGLNNVFLIGPGIDRKRFACSPLPLESGLRLMVGSAPWTRAQFKTKGVDALLQAAHESSRLHLTFLWRGVLAEEMEQRVCRLELEEQVEVLNRVMDVNEVLAGVHASVTLASEPDVVKAYPHSLLESLAAGKPVLVSRAIPMASYVEEERCGVVVEAVNPADVITAVETLEQSYVDLQTAAGRTGQQDFSQQQMIDSYKSIYEHVLASTR
jgi:glycosyltransferase involved in cell wall biosynthesis